MIIVMENGECVESGTYEELMEGIDDKQTSYDDIGERKALEQAAKVLFG